MGCLVDFFVEFFVELFGEGFVSLSEAFIPAGLSKKKRKIIKTVSAVISVILLLGMVTGIVLLVDTKGENLWGWLPIILGAVYIIFGAVLDLKRRKL